MRNVGLGLFVLFMVGCGASGGAAGPAASSPASAGDAPADAAPPPPAEAAPGGAAPGVSFESAAGPATTPAAAPPAAAAAPPAAPPAPPAAAPPAARPAAAPSPAAARPAGAAAVAKAADAPVAVARPEPEVARRLPQGGQLTAGVWDDNRNFDFWTSYARPFQQRGSDFALFSAAEMADAARASAQGQPRTELDVQLVLDTTGSMGDELAYLQGEFDAIAARLGKKFPNVKPRWSLVVYRDRGDQYVTRPFDFTTDVAKFRQALREQSADGGGDTPEAVVEGLGAGLRQGWRGGANVAKVAFWVADAPTHPGEGRALAGLIREARQKGVHLYPVASSDTDEVAEYQMRSAAQMTGGRYLFLTNDSGIGNGHAEPHIPCYHATRLDHAIVRMLSIELSGRYLEAESTEVIRSVGSPDREGKCRLSSGQPVVKF
ncbi:MAG TPA: vWA domain-containing protein [Polyangiaceae bacterium]|nr:vWA domain-containing protein [Polyangiaceae bacterium]